MSIAWGSVRAMELECHGRGHSAIPPSASDGASVPRACAHCAMLPEQSARVMEPQCQGFVSERP